MKMPVINRIVLMAAAMLISIAPAIAQQPDEKPANESKQTIAAVEKRASESTTPGTGETAKTVPANTVPEPAGPEKWTFEAKPYLWAAALEGDVRVRNTTANVDSSFSDVFKQLDFAFATQFEAIKRRWRIMVDENYVNLGTTGRGPAGENTKIEPTLNWLEGAVSYAPLLRANENSTATKPLPPVISAEFLAGARYTHFGLGLQRGTNPEVKGSRNRVDLFVGNRIMARPHPAVTFIGKYTVGGGGSHGSHFAWTFDGLVDLRFKKTMSAWFGYRMLDMDANKPANAVGFNGQFKGLILGMTMYR